MAIAGFMVGFILHELRQVNSDQLNNFFVSGQFLKIKYWTGSSEI